MPKFSFAPKSKFSHRPLLQSTANHQPPTNHGPPTTYHSQPATIQEPPPTSHHPPTIDHRQPATIHQPPTTTAVSAADRATFPAYPCGSATSRPTPSPSQTPASYFPHCWEGGDYRCSFKLPTSVVKTYMLLNIILQRVLRLEIWP